MEVVNYEKIKEYEKKFDEQTRKMREVLDSEIILTKLDILIKYYVKFEDTGKIIKDIQKGIDLYNKYHKNKLRVNLETNKQGKWIIVVRPDETTKYLHSYIIYVLDKTEHKSPKPKKKKSKLEEIFEEILIEDVRNNDFVKHELSRLWSDTEESQGLELRIRRILDEFLEYFILKESNDGTKLFINSMLVRDIIYYSLDPKETRFNKLTEVELRACINIQQTLERNRWLIEISEDDKKETSDFSQKLIKNIKNNSEDPEKTINEFKKYYGLFQ
jgi:hypothetical protein